MTPEDWDALADAALAARENAYAPYSGYRVGAALRCMDGTVFLGCNVENASYPVSICAERGALSAAIVAGQRKLHAIAIATRGPQPGTPCGMCRQALSELAPDLEILLVTPENTRQTWSLTTLLPGSFGPSALKRP